MVMNMIRSKYDSDEPLGADPLGVYRRYTSTCISIKSQQYEFTRYACYTSMQYTRYTRIVNSIYVRLCYV